MDTLKLDWLSDSRIAVVTLNRPDALNAMNTLMIQELLNLFREQTHNEALRCGVITGRGTRAFSTGGDLKERDGMSNDQWRRQHQLIEEMFKAMWDFPIPIIAAVEGFAFAGGCEIALGADFIVASATAQFALKEVTRGILPGGGGLQNLARSIGMRRAREMIYTGLAINAETAYAWGLVNRVVSRRRCAQERTRISRTDR
jgi:enoyl-CoA hydratase